jgi:2-hydroxycyclohexanecarboxyl-CoA dehydrogenase
MQLNTRIALVTGAGSGIGQAIAVTLAEQGAKVIVTDMSAELAAQTAKLIQDQHGVALSYGMNVCEPEQIAHVREQLLAQNMAPNVLVNNAGWSTSQAFLKNTPELWDKLIDINLMGVIRVTRAFLEPMVQSEKGGSVVNVSSDAGRVGSSGESVYAAAKGGVIALTKSLARELTRYRINVNCVCPGPTETQLLRANPENYVEALLKAIPMRRFADPKDIAQAVAYFSSEPASYVTGQIMSVSGGLTMAG